MCPTHKNHTAVEVDGRYECSESGCEKRATSAHERCVACQTVLKGPLCEFQSDAVSS